MGNSGIVCYESLVHKNENASLHPQQDYKPLEFLITITKVGHLPDEYTINAIYSLERLAPRAREPVDALIEYLQGEGLWQAITPNVGTESTAIDIDQNTTLVTTVQASDPQPDPVPCSITEGADAALFGMNHLSGDLPSLNAADFEDPGDTDLDNVCNGIVQAEDASSGQTGKQSISVTVSDVNEAPAFAGGALACAVYRKGTRLGVGLTGEALGDRVGWAISTAGDTNGDGFWQCTCGRC